MKVVVEGFHFWETELYRNQFLSGNCWERVFVSQRCLRKFHLHKTHSVTFNKCDTKLVLRAASSWLELNFWECSDFLLCFGYYYDLLKQIIYNHAHNYYFNIIMYLFYYIGSGYFNYNIRYFRRTVGMNI